MKRAVGILGGILLACAASGPPDAYAHEDLRTEIQAVTRRIARTPEDANLYLMRGELLRLERRWSAAAHDYERAARLDPALPEVEVCRARLDLDRGRPEEARRRMESVLTRGSRGDDLATRIAALTIQARALERLDRPLEAVACLDTLLDLRSAPSPDQVLWRHRLLVAEHRLERSLAGLDEAILRLGPVISLELAALDVEVALGRYPEALARLDRLETQLPPSVLLTVRRAEILETAGRTRDARAAYETTLVTIENLPRGRRGTEMIRELERAARAGLERLR